MSNTTATDRSFEELAAEALAAYEGKDWQSATTLCLRAADAAPSAAERSRFMRRAAAAFRHRGDLDTARELLGSMVRERRVDEWTRRELARLHAAVAASVAQSKYWLGRRRSIYLMVVREMATRVGSNANSVLDVGSNGTPILQWFPEVPTRVSVDLRRPYRAPGVTSVKADFLQWEPGQQFDVALCLQVLEHVPDAAAFAQKLLQSAEVVIASVPYKWPEGKVRFHVHDPVDEAKLHDWFQRPPNYSYLARELDGQERLIVVYDKKRTEPWSSVAEADFLFRWTLRGARELTELGRATAGLTAGAVGDEESVARLATLLAASEERYRRLRSRRSVRAGLALSSRFKPLFELWHRWRGGRTR